MKSLKTNRTIQVCVASLTLMFLLSACGEGSSTIQSTQDSRFVKEKSAGDGVTLIKDLQTGCEYIEAYGYTSWTYVHGSCVAVIQSEQAKP